MDEYAKSFRTRAACRIADIDPQRFNEDVAAGDYPCAPSTRSGVSRVFDETDIVGLFIYSRLTRRPEPYRLSKKLAASVAQGVMGKLRESPDTDPARVDFPFDDAGYCMGAREGDPPSFVTPEGIHVATTVCFDVKRIREFVRQRVVDEANILGEED